MLYKYKNLQVIVLICGDNHFLRKIKKFKIGIHNVYELMKLGISFVININYTKKIIMVS